MSETTLKPFNFSPEVIARMRDTQQIPVNFYNANGQVLIPRKEQATGDMINKLTIKYNRQRQANITKELIEIISGAEAL